MGTKHLSQVFFAACCVVNLNASMAAEASLLARINAELGHGVCSADADCTTIPIGEKACGGPERWLASTGETAKKPALQPLLDKLITLQKKRNAQSGLLSNCRITPDPGAICRANRCVVRPANGAV